MQADMEELEASYVNELEQFGADVQKRIEEAILRWRAALVALIGEAALAHPARVSVDNNSLADLYAVIMEGTYIVSKAVNDPKMTAEQLAHYRQYLELIFPE